MELQGNINILTKDFNLDEITLLGVNLNQNSNILLDKLSITEKEITGNSWVNTHNDDFYCYRTSDNKIVEFLIRKEGLDPLKIKEEQDIENLFGKADSIEKKNSWHYYFYSNKNLVVSWHNRDKKIWGIYIGNTRITPTIYTVKDFLEIYLQFVDLVPKQSEWNEEAISSNPPRLYRLQQLKSLMKAFDIGENLSKDFKNGSFLRGRGAFEYKLINNDVEKYVDNLESQSYKERKKRQLEDYKIQNGRSLSFTFTKFLDVIERADNLLKINSGVMEASTIMGGYTVNKVWDLANSIDKEKLDEVKDLLCSMIDSEQKTFSQKILTEKYNFPDVDLEEIDMDWW
ncbi:hypothetical protein WAF17_07575 [Bernardetia sp. ABR2-2B]|uniref:hypothetical protein n=1 Tax=Bernardetia sp. ABR2-2B TaxID=3127472 RepID=UPI0030D25D71